MDRPICTETNQTFRLPFSWEFKASSSSSMTIECNEKKDQWQRSIHKSNHILNYSTTTTTIRYYYYYYLPPRISGHFKLLGKKNEQEKKVFFPFSRFLVMAKWRKKMTLQYRFWWISISIFFSFHSFSSLIGRPMKKKYNSIRMIVSWSILANLEWMNEKPEENVNEKRLEKFVALFLYSV